MAQTFNNGESNATVRTKLNGNAGEINENTADIEALDTEKAPIANPTFTGTVSGITKAMVGLSSVDNTADSAKPISTATQTALDAKAPINNPTFTGTVGGITKTAVGLGNVDNTADASKPVSTAQAQAIALKAPIASPTFTGTVSGITKAMVGLGNVDNTSDANKPISNAAASEFNNKQPNLVSGENIRPINGESILGSENLVIAGSVSDGDKGDVTVASTGTVWTVPSLADKADLEGGEVPIDQLPPSPLSDVDFVQPGGEGTTISLSVTRLNDIIAAWYAANVGEVNPPAETPTGLTVDDVGKTLAWAMEVGETYADFEFTQNAAANIIVATANPMPVTPPKAINTVGVRRKATSSLAASAWAYNQIEFSESSGGEILPGTFAMNIVNGFVINDNLSNVVDVWGATDNNDSYAVTRYKVGVDVMVMAKITADTPSFKIAMTASYAQFTSEKGISWNAGELSVYSDVTNVLTPQPSIGDFVVIKKVTGPTDADKIFEFYKTTDGITFIPMLLSGGSDPYLIWVGNDTHAAFYLYGAGKLVSPLITNVDLTETP